MKVTPENKIIKSVTMLDVAKRAGVSGATASCVLNGSTGNVRVGSSTRSRVLLAAKELSYTPNALARAFRSQRTNIIGLYLGYWLVNTHHVFLAEVISGLQLGCNEHRKDLLIHGTFRGASVDDVYSELINGKVDGLVMFARDGDPLVKKLEQSSLPAITVADSVAGLPSVVVDDAGGSSMLAQYLLEQGHETVIYKCVSTPQSSARRRKEAFLRSAHSIGLEVLVHDTAEPWPDRGFSESDLKAITAGPGGKRRATAFVCSTDLFAFEILHECSAHGFRVPEDIAVVGFDGIDPPRWNSPRLTTIQAPWSDVSRTAVQLLMRRISGEQVPMETELPVELIKGDTA